MYLFYNKRHKILKMEINQKKRIAVIYAHYETVGSKINF